MFYFYISFIFSTIYQTQNYSNRLILSNEYNYFIFSCVFWKSTSSSQSAGIELHDISKNITIQNCGFYFLTCTNSGNSAACFYTDFADSIKCLNLCFINSYCKSSGASYIFHSGINANILYADLNYSSETNIGKNGRKTDYSSHLGAYKKLSFFNSNVSNCETLYRGIVYFLVSKNNSIISNFLIISNSIGEGLITTNLGGLKAIITNFNLINNTANSYLISNPWSSDILNIENFIFINYNNINFHNPLKCLLTFINCYFSGLENNAKSTGATFISCNFNLIGNLISLNNINTVLCWNLGICFTLKKKQFYYFSLISDFIYLN